LIIEDHFFSTVEDFDSLYSYENLPQKVIRVVNHLAAEQDLISLYGTDKIDQLKDYTCGGDLIASALFMLTRWEEMIADQKDEFGRFPDEESIAFKYQFFDRPIVYEYVEFIWQAPKLTRINTSFLYEPTIINKGYNPKVIHKLNFSAIISGGANTKNQRVTLFQCSSFFIEIIKVFTSIAVYTVV